MKTSSQISNSVTYIIILAKAIRNIQFTYYNRLANKFTDQY